ncbi:MAG: hypothetical protein AB1700_05130 [Bacillota bacterium]
MRRFLLEGDETDRLHRWGYRNYRDMFNERQLLCLELACREISRCPGERVGNALATNLSDLLRYQNMLCRYDTTALKSLDIFSVHGFPVGLVQCESNFLGITSKVKGATVGSGGWTNITEKYTRAKSYCEKPFEIVHRQAKKTVVYTLGEWIGDRRNTGRGTVSRHVRLVCDSAASAEIAPRGNPSTMGQAWAVESQFCHSLSCWKQHQEDPGQAEVGQNEMPLIRQAGSAAEAFMDSLHSVKN